MGGWGKAVPERQGAAVCVCVCASAWTGAGECVGMRSSREARLRHEERQRVPPSRTEKEAALADRPHKGAEMEEGVAWW